jgi:hypothetical protein
VPAARLPLVSEHRYRLVGKVRLLLFWISADDVGGARMTWRLDGEDGDELALLIGSDPDRAPRRVNEWGYIREQVRGDDARVFGVRTITDADSLEAARATLDGRDGRAVFGAICSRVTAQDMTSAVATVTGPADVTWRHALRRDLRRRGRARGRADPGDLSAEVVVQDSPRPRRRRQCSRGAWRRRGDSPARGRGLRTRVGRAARGRRSAGSSSAMMRSTAAISSRSRCASVRDTALRILVSGCFVIPALAHERPRRCGGSASTGATP